MERLKEKELQRGKTHNIFVRKREIPISGAKGRVVEKRDRPNG